MNSPGDGLQTMSAGLKPQKKARELGTLELKHDLEKLQTFRTRSCDRTNA